MTVFVTVADEGGFAPAARRLRLSAPAVTRAVADLESHLGVMLLQRTTRSVRLTDAGAAFLQDARRLLAELAEAEDRVTGANARPKGHLVITAPALFGRLHVMPGILEFLQRYPETSVTALFLDRVVNLLEEGVDVGVRIGEMPDSSLHARTVGEVRRVICAAPAYLQRNGTPTKPADLTDHATITATGLTPGMEWRFGSPGSEQVVRLQSRLAVTTNDAAVEAALQGFGIVRLLSYQVAHEVAAGRLVCVLAAFEPPPQPVSVVHNAGRQASAKVRAMVDLLAARLIGDASLPTARKA